MHAAAPDRPEAHMNGRKRHLRGAAVLAASMCGPAAAQAAPEPLVRIAEIEIDPAQLPAYKAAVTEEIETSIRVEPGVLAIYSVAVKDNPTHLRFFEIYADDAAYQQHLASPHFKKYVAATKAMITARTLMETVPIVLGSKASFSTGKTR
jgi:quinol monooxygenase YgiN